MKKEGEEKREEGKESRPPIHILGYATGPYSIPTRLRPGRSACMRYIEPGTMTLSDLRPVTDSTQHTWLSVFVADHTVQGSQCEPRCMLVYMGHDWHPLPARLTDST